MPNAFDFDLSPILMSPIMYSMGADIVNSYLSHHKVVELQKSNVKFDICVFEVFASDALLVSQPSH